MSLVLCINALLISYVEPFSLEHDLNPLQPEVDPRIPVALREDLVPIDFIGKVDVELEELLDLGHVFVVLPPQRLIHPYEKVTSLIPAPGVKKDRIWGGRRCGRGSFRRRGLIYLIEPGDGVDLAINSVNCRDE